jgi:hypothetical protein
VKITAIYGKEITNESKNSSILCFAGFGTGCKRSILLAVSCGA